MSIPVAQGPFVDDVSPPTGSRSAPDVVDPAVGTLVGRVARATTNDARATLDSAARAQPRWESMGAQARAKILVRAAKRPRSRREDPAKCITGEMGKAPFGSRAEVDGAIAPGNFPARAWSWEVRFPPVRLWLGGPSPFRRPSTE